MISNFLSGVVGGESTAEKMRTRLATRINHFFEMNHVDYRCVESKLQGTQSMISIRRRGEAAACRLFFRVKENGVLVSTPQILHLILLRNDECEENKIRDVFLFHPATSRVPAILRGKKVNSVKYVETLTEDDLLGHVFCFLQKYVLTFSPVETR